MLRNLLFFQLLCISGFSQSIQDMALPKITHYDTKNMGFSSKSWDIKQDNDGLIYVANGEHILIYDGIHWNSLIPQAGSSTRSLLVKNKDSIYFGADGHNGLLIREGLSNYQIISKQRVNKNIISDSEEYWRTYLINDQIVFQTFKNLYINQRNIVTKIQAPHRFKWSYKVDGHLYVNDIKEGVFKLNNTDLVPVVSDKDLNDNIIGVTNMEDGTLLVITDTEGLFKIVQGSLIPLDLPELAEIKKAQIFSFLKLADGRIALGTVSNGLYIIDLKTGKTENLDKKTGLQNNTILSIFQDDENNLWVTLDYGIDYIKLNSELTYFYDYNGKLGSVYTVINDKNLSYIGTNQGLYVADNTNNKPEFDLWLNGQVWNIDKINNHVFIGHDKGPFISDGTSLTKIGEDLGVWNFKEYSLPTKEKVIISGNYNGISLYEKTGGEWASYKLKGFFKSSRFLEIDVQNNIWVALGAEGVFKFGLNYSAKEVTTLAFYPLSTFNGKPISLSKIDEEIVVTADYRSYIYSYKNNKFSSSALKENTGRAPRMIKNDKDTWFMDDDIATLQHPDGISTFPELKDQLIPGVRNIFPLNEQQQIIPVYNGFALYTKNRKNRTQPRRDAVLIRSFSSVNTKKKYTANSEIPYADNDLKISYVLPIYGEEVQYQIKLNNQDWSEWNNSTEKYFYNLLEGTYTLDIKAKYNNEIKEATYSFIVKPPIYRTIWAYISYFLLFILIVITIITYNKYKMKKQEKILLHQKADKLHKQEEVYKAHKLDQERKIIELNNTKLQDEIKAKNRELTQIAYVNLNKNKILKKIKDKIIKVQESSEQKLPTHTYNELIRLVEYYITDKENKLFEINFDKSHQDFYEALSKKHPSLTSKDLRLCAYLKMNLSSKEIAPLLGISSQSVDVSRHRLRKKLNLDSQDNLTNALINLK